MGFSEAPMNWVMTDWRRGAVPDRDLPYQADRAVSCDQTNLSGQNGVSLRRPIGGIHARTDEDRTR
jgi:hypothetical protein